MVIPGFSTGTYFKRHSISFSLPLMLIVSPLTALSCDKGTARHS
jgi:hypothetical protein